jgi:hypothetical protein
MSKNKIIGIVSVLLGVILILAIGGARLMRSGKLNSVPNLGGQSSKMMGVSGIAPGYPMRDFSLGAPEDAGRIAEQITVPAGEVAPASDGAEKRVIKNGNLNLRVDRVDEANREMARIAGANGGEVFASNVYINPSNQIKSGSATVRVPVGNFQKTFEELKKTATLVISESTSGQDVTEEYADLQARLKNKQAEEASIAKILERAGDIDDVLKVTRELNRVRGEIERLQAQVKMTESQTDKATIYVSMTEDQDVTVVDSWRPWQLAKDSLNRLVQGIQRSVDFVIVLVISILPILILYFVLAYLLYRLGRKTYLRWKEKRDQNRQ